jgi:ketosteroid isomerase-like protein
MKKIFLLLWTVLFALQGNAQNLTGSTEDRRSLDKATDAIRDAFAKGDAELATSLHSPDIIKYFGGNNVVAGRQALKKTLLDWFQNSTVEFIENKVESTVFAGETAIQTVIYGIKSTPENGAAPVIASGRSMVIYMRDKTSPTGWFSLREITQDAPGKTE